jgi:endoglucanase
MRAASKQFLVDLLSAPGPSGYEGPVRKVWEAEVKKYADRVEVDVHGNAVGIYNADGGPRIMFAGHMDELGFQVIYIDDKGYLYFETIGGFDLQIIPGRKVRVHTAKGPVMGVLGKKPIHLMQAADRRKVPSKHDLWIDIGVKGGKEAKKLVAIGDPVTYDSNYEDLRNGLAVSRGFDNKAGAWVVAEALRRVSRAKRKCRAAIHSVATVQEEVGLRGARTSAYGVDPLVGIAVDVTWAMDHPGVDKRQVGECNLGSGPVITRGANVNPVVFERLVQVAKKKKIPHQIQAEPGGTGTDANAIQLSRAGVATGLVSVPQRYMHTPVEIVALADLDNTAKLLAEFALSVDEKTSFIP